MDWISIEPYRKFCVGGFFAVGIETRGDELDVVRLPSHRWESCIKVSSLDTVDSSAGISFVVEPERIEDLCFVSALVIDAAITATLPHRLGNKRGTELKVESIVLKRIFRGHAGEE